MTYDEDSYPNSFFYDSAYREYERINVEYNNLYSRICGMLAFCGVVFTIVINMVVDIHTRFTLFSGLCIGCSLLLVFMALCKLLGCLRGEKLTVIKVDQFRNTEFLKDSEDEIKAWLTEQLIDCVEVNKRVREEKQIRFNNSLNWFGGGFIMFLIGILWEVFK